MSIIPCNTDCKYQKEGYCELKSTAQVTNTNEKGCAHYIKKTADDNTPADENDFIE